MGKATSVTVLVLTLSIVLTSSLLAYMKPVSAIAESGAAIDLFTQTSPFDGKGSNQSSGVFEPQELVALRALVTYNDGPLCSMLVAFQVIGPQNPYQNITFIGTGTTDETGMTEFSFRLPWPCLHPEEITFGEWSAIATVNVAGQVVVDVLTFQSGWILRIIEIRTLNSQLKLQSVFARGDPIVFNLTVENTALTEKLATIKIDVQDFGKQPIIHVQMDGVLFQPGKRNVQAPSEIPLSAEIGVANVSAAPYTAAPEDGGRLYSPAVYTTFQIAGKDIAITDVKLSSNLLYVGQTLGINITLFNKGNETETFDLSTFCNSSLIETRNIAELAPLAYETFSFIWNTSNAAPGFYEMSASAPLPEDANPADNTYVDGIVEVRSGMPPERIHDVAVLGVIPSSRLVTGGEIVSINVTVKNEGTETESFNVIVYYESLPIEKKYVADLGPSNETQILVKWNTSGVLPMDYVISAEADIVEGETHVADNVFVDGAVTILSFPPYFPPSELVIFWVFVIIALVAAVVFLFIILAFDRMRRRRRSPSAFTVVVHPHI